MFHLINTSFMLTFVDVDLSHTKVRLQMYLFIHNLIYHPVEYGTPQHILSKMIYNLRMFRFNVI